MSSPSMSPGMTTSSRRGKRDKLRRESSIKQSYGSPMMSSFRSSERESIVATNPVTTSFDGTKGSTGNKIGPSLKWTTNVLAQISVLLFSGTVFGWAPMKLVLIYEGEFSELCDDVDLDGPCAAQLEKFNLIFTVAQFLVSFQSLPVGYLLDTFDKTYTYAVAGIFQVSGLLLFGTSHSGNDGYEDHFLLGYSLMALSGGMTMLLAFPASFLIPERQAGILAATSCFFDASSAVFVVFETIYFHYGGGDDDVFSRQDFFYFLATVAAIIYGSLFVCWVILEKRDWKSAVAEAAQEYERKQLLAEAEAEEAEAEEAEDKDEDEGKEEDDVHMKRIKDFDIHEMSLGEQLCTMEFVLVLVFASLQMLRCNFYIETINEMLGSIGGEDAGSNVMFYATVFSFVLPCGIFFVPIIEGTFEKIGVLKTLNLTNFLGLIFGFLLFVPSLKLQVLAFFLFACFRAYLYASLNTFIAVTFGVNTMGRVIGTTFTVAATATLLQYPFATFAEKYCDNDFVPVQTIMIGIALIPIILVRWYRAKATEALKTIIAATDDERIPLV